MFHVEFSQFKEIFINPEDAASIVASFSGLIKIVHLLSFELLVVYFSLILVWCLVGFKASQNFFKYFIVY